MPMAGNPMSHPMMARPAVATLLLIENSQALSNNWADLRDQYLRPLVDKLKSANPGALITTAILESHPSELQALNPAPRQYDGLHNGHDNIRFGYGPENRLSISKISSGIEFLLSLKISAARHLVIVAASTPLEDSVSLTFSAHTGRSLWHQLAQKLAQADIHCHLVLTPTEDITPLMTLFDETLRLQNNIEEPPPVPLTSTNIYIRLSAKRPQSLYPSSAPYPDNTFRRGISPNRSYTYPSSDTYSTPAFEDPLPSEYAEGQSDHPPSLVSQLQQVHGLTKKKVYGNKPSRQPFFKEERVREKQRKAPAPLTMPLDVPATTSPSASFPSGRAVSRSRADRIMRVSQGSPTELHPRHYHSYSRRGSRLSSPEAELSSPASTSGYAEVSQMNSYFPPMASPISPISVDETYANAAKMQPLGSYLPLDGSILADKPWQHPPPLASPLIPQHDYSPFQLQPSLPVTNLPSRASEGDLAAMRYQMPLNQAHSLTNSTPSIMSSERGQLSTRSRVNSLATARSHRTSRSSPQDEEPFTFNEEYVAATAALFQEEVLPAYPNFPAIDPPAPSSTPPKGPLSRHGFYFASEHDSQPPSPSYQTGELYGSRVRQEQPRQEDVALTYSVSFSPGSSSSLQGWAG